MEKIAWEKAWKISRKNGEKMRPQSVGKMWKTKEWKECENLTWKVLEKNVEKIGVEKTSINGLEEVKSVEKYQCGKKRDKFEWKNITYLVVG